MDVKDILVAAKQAVEDADIPQDLRSTAFGKAVDLIAGVPRQTEGAPPRTATSTPLSVDQSDSDTALVRIAKRLNLEPAIVEGVYHEENGEIHLTVPPRKLEDNKSGATKQLALLVAAGRQGAGIEERTSTVEIRKVVDDFKKYDENNFARSIGEMVDAFSILGSARKRTVKVSRPGWISAADLVNKLGGGEN